MATDATRQRVQSIREMFEDHVAIAGGKTDLLNDMEFLLGIAEEHMREGAVLMPTGQPPADSGPAPVHEPKADNAKRAGRKASPKAAKGAAGAAKEEPAGRGWA